MDARHVPPLTDCPLGQAWAGSSVNASAFRCEGILTVGEAQIGAYYGPQGQVVVFRRSLTGDAVQRTEISPQSPDDLPWDAHRSISIGIDRDRCIHLGYGAHASTVKLLKGPPGLDISEFSPSRPDLARVTDSVTYPSFLTVGDPPRLVMLYREGLPNSGALRLRLFDEASGRWVDPPEPLLDGRGHRNCAGPYLNRPVVLDDGTVCAFLVWRLRLPPEAGADVVNSGLDLVAFRGDDLGAVETLSGMALPRPAGPMHTERVAAVPFRSDLMNQAGAAVDPHGQPAAVTWWRDPADEVPQVRLVRRRSGSWRATRVSDFATDFALSGRGTLPLPHSRPYLLFAPDGRGLVVFRSAEYGGRLMAVIVPQDAEAGDTAETVVLWPSDLGYYEPIVDPEAWQSRGRLSMFVQPCAQQRGDGAGDDLTSADCRIVEWARAAIFGR
ncbi:BNR-4 repeat-containing protein [Microbaculum marinum]|uniref:BNR-4 repeat-containing protein n=1 Tax=Microbaculum marinum TaxID=1764581 RepID=A0AAW9RDD9_9HYPH